MGLLSISSCVCPPSNPASLNQPLVYNGSSIFAFLSIISPLDNIYLKWQQIGVFFQLDRKAACGLVKETLSLIPISPQWAFQLGNYSHVKGDSAESPAALWEHLSPTDANYLAREPSPLCGRSEGSESAGSANPANAASNQWASGGCETGTQKEK